MILLYRARPLGILLVLATMATLSACPMPAPARDNAAWEASDATVREWYQSLTQPDNPASSCCGEADAYWADSFEISPKGEYVAIITDERKIEGRPYIAPGTKFVVPNVKLKYDAGNPTGHGVIFVMEEYAYVLCYIAPGGV